MLRSDLGYTFSYLLHHQYLPRLAPSFSSPLFPPGPAGDTYINHPHTQRVLRLLSVQYQAHDTFQLLCLVILFRCAAVQQRSEVSVGWGGVCLEVPTRLDGREQAAGDQSRRSDWAGRCE
jgi:hypothetical protein